MRRLRVVGKPVEVVGGGGGRGAVAEGGGGVVVGETPAAIVLLLLSASVGIPGDFRKGPCTYDVRKILGILDTPPPPRPHFTQPISTVRPQN